jgi:energy-coupling factor transporter ATP-binding protein EcfA2
MWGMSVMHLGRVAFRDRDELFGITNEDRFSHIYVIGKTGTGKSTLLETMALQDLARGNGFALIDPHGDLVERVAARIPQSRQSDVIYFDTPDAAQPYGYNPLRHVRHSYIPLATSGLMEVFKKMWPDAWGVRMEHILRNVLMALLEQPDATMHDILRVFIDRDFRRKIARSLRNETVKRFLDKEFERFSFGYRTDGTASIQNKVGAFLSDPLLDRILTSPKTDLHIRQIMDDGKVLLVNLAKGQLGEDSSSLLGGLLVTTMAWRHTVVLTYLPNSAGTSSSTSTNSKASPLLRWPTCSQSFVSTGSALPLPTSIWINLSRKSDMRSSAMQHP